MSEFEVLLIVNVVSAAMLLVLNVLAIVVVRTCNRRNKDEPIAQETFEDFAGTLNKRMQELQNSRLAPMGRKGFP